ncbi:hypothetical protein [Nocardia asiatica]|uniref:hypothetical protein n=1 Tax=Nocardia asiatica TaxID=209252 RepID=UPI003EE09840
MVDSTDWESHLVSAEIMAQRQVLAERVVAELRLAGLPAGIYTRERVGANVAIDKLPAAEGGGVSVHWGPDPRIKRAACGFDPDIEPDGAAWDYLGQALTEGRLPDEARPHLAHIEVIEKAMYTAIVTILTSAGTPACEVDNFGIYVAIESP